MNILDAFYRTVHDAIGGCEALAVRLGMSAQILRNKANPNNSANRVLLEDVDQIMGITGDARVLHALAGNHGYVCVKLDDAVPATNQAILEGLAQVITGHGHVGNEVLCALADGIVERHEVDEVKARVYSAMQSLQQLVVCLEATSKAQQATRRVA